MPIIKNPFKSKAQSTTNDPVRDASLAPTSNGKTQAESTRPSTQIARQAEPDYKLSSVSPEGTFMPPSPPEKASFLSRFRNTSSLTQDKALTTDEQSGFVIPRESFDTYRRSFDIRPSMDGSGSVNDGRPSRSSLDMLTATGTASPRKPSQIVQSMQALTSSTSAGTTSNKQENVLFPPLSGEVINQTDDRGFEDIKLDDDTAVKKRHFWQKTSNISAGLKKERNEGNELRPIRLNQTESLAVPGKSGDAPETRTSQLEDVNHKGATPVSSAPGKATGVLTSSSA